MQAGNLEAGGFANPAALLEELLRAAAGVAGSGRSAASLLHELRETFQLTLDERARKDCRMFEVRAGPCASREGGGLQCSTD